MITTSSIHRRYSMLDLGTSWTRRCRSGTSLGSVFPFGFPADHQAPRAPEIRRGIDTWWLRCCLPEWKKGNPVFHVKNDIDLFKHQTVSSAPFRMSFQPSNTAALGLSGFFCFQNCMSSDTSPSRLPLPDGLFSIGRTTFLSY